MMNKIGIALLTVLALVACKKNDPVSDDVPLSERLPGTWSVVAVDYSGEAPSPIDPNVVLPFTGSGENVSGYFRFEADTNLGEFEMKFIAKVNIGTGSPVSIPTNTKRGGFYEVLDDEKIVRMSDFDRDSIYDWEVRLNTASRQKWFVVMYHDWGLPGLDSVPINVEATFER